MYLGTSKRIIGLYSREQNDIKYAETHFLNKCREESWTFTMACVRTFLDDPTTESEMLFYDEVMKALEKKDLSMLHGLCYHSEFGDKLVGTLQMFSKRMEAVV